MYVGGWVGWVARTLNPPSPPAPTHFSAMAWTLDGHKNGSKVGWWWGGLGYLSLSDKWRVTAGNCRWGE